MSDSGAWHVQLVAHETATTDAWHAERRSHRDAEPQRADQHESGSVESEPTLQ